MKHQLNEHVYTAAADMNFDQFIIFLNQYTCFDMYSKPIIYQK